MSDRDDNASAQNIKIDALLAKIKTLEDRVDKVEDDSEIKPRSNEEGVRERIQRERKERIDANRDSKMVTYPSSKRPDQTTHTRSSVSTPQITPSSPKTSSQPLPVSALESSHPFKIIVGKKNNQTFWKVKDIGSTIMDGTNGDLLTIEGLDTETNYNGDKFVVVSSTITDGDVGDWTVKAVSTSDDILEVVLDEATIPTQTGIKLLVGRVFLDGNSPKKQQFCNTGQRLVQSFHNGLLVHTLESAPGQDQ